MSVCIPCNESPDQEEVCGVAVVPAPVASSDERAGNQSTLNRASDNKFLLVLDVPRLIQTQGQQGETCTTDPFTKLEYNVFGHVVPRVSIPHVKLPYDGHVMNISSHNRENSSPLNVNFKVDNTFGNYWILWQWLDFIWKADRDIAGQGLNVNVAPKSYMTTITVYGLDGYNTPRISWTYRDAFITSLAEINYNFQSQGEIASAFTFAYSHVTCMRH